MKIKSYKLTLICNLQVTMQKNNYQKLENSQFLHSLFCKNCKKFLIRLCNRTHLLSLIKHHISNCSSLLSEEVVKHLETWPDWRVSMYRNGLPYLKRINFNPGNQMITAPEWLLRLRYALRWPWTGSGCLSGSSAQTPSSPRWTGWRHDSEIWQDRFSTGFKRRC